MIRYTQTTPEWLHPVSDAKHDAESEIRRLLQQAKDDDNYPAELLRQRREEFVESALVARRETILYYLEETRLTHEEAKTLHEELAEIEVKLEPF